MQTKTFSAIANVTCLAALAILLCALLSGCATEAAADGKKLVVTQDDSLDVLTTTVAGGAEVAQPGDGWALGDNYVQLQLGGASIGGDVIESVYQNGDTVTVNLENAAEQSTMDLVVTEYKLTGLDSGTTVKKVRMNYPDGTSSELTQCCIPLGGTTAGTSGGGCCTG